MTDHSRPTSADLPACILEALETFEREYTELLRADHPLLRPVLDQILGSRGKRIRPSLFFLFQAAFSGSASGKETIPVLIEMLHEASLIHDDVVDTSLIRRNQKSMNAVWGNKIAVLCGDFLMAKILHQGIHAGIDGLMEVLSEKAMNMSLGELRQAVADPSYMSRESTYFKTVEDKTAGLFSAACELGSLAGGADSKNRELAARFGLIYGTIFQIRDDILDVTGSEEALGKPANQDLADGKITLPLILSLNGRPASEQDEVLAQLKRGSAKDCRRLKKYITEHRGIDAAAAQERLLADKAAGILEQLPDSPYIQPLADLIAAGLERKR